MKKLNLLIAFVLIALSSFAQEGLVSKKGEPILPESGDWAISIDASPFLKYAGNFIGSNGLNEAPTFEFLSGNQTILGKYFINATKAYRVGLRLGYGSTTTTTEESSIPLVSPIIYVDNVSKNSFSNIGLTAGMEWRKGKTRLQGFYGAEAGFALGTANWSYTHGNALSSSNPTSQLTEYKPGTTFRLGLRAFIGAEYFILPKVAIGGEFGWGLAFRTSGEATSTRNYWTGSTVNSTTDKLGGSSSFEFDSENLNSVFGSTGSIRLSLHF